MTKWAVYYDDGSVFSSEMGDPWDAPAYGVLVIWQEDPHDKLCNSDYYLWREDYGCWIEVKPDGLVDHLVDAVRQIKAVLVGRTVPAPVWKETMRRMNQYAEEARRR